MLSNEKLTPISDKPLIKSELESRVKMLLSGSVACNMKFGEHSSSAKDDIAEAKELVNMMIDEYGMGSSIIPRENEKIELIQTHKCKY